MTHLPTSIHVLFFVLHGKNCHHAFMYVYIFLCAGIATPLDPAVIIAPIAVIAVVLLIILIVLLVVVFLYVRCIS